MLWCKDKLLIDFDQRHRHKADERVANALEPKGNLAQLVPVTE